MYVEHNSEVRSYNNCCGGKAISITYIECAFAESFVFQFAIQKVKDQDI